MKLIFVQKKMFIFTLSFSLLFASLGLYGGFFQHESFFGVLYVALGLFVSSFVFLANRISFDNEKIVFKCIYRKGTVRIEEIKEIFVEYGFVNGGQMIINFEKMVGCDCWSYAEYRKKCKELKIKDYTFLFGVAKKDMLKLLSVYKGKIQGYV